MTDRTGRNSLVGRLVSGVLSNWVSVFTSIAVTFFLSPFVVRQLGTPSTAYGS